MERRMKHLNIPSVMKVNSNTIVDLFSHSYTLPSPSTNTSVRWLWVEAARVWAHAAATFPDQAAYGDMRGYAGMKRQGETGEGRDVRKMTEQSGHIATKCPSARVKKGMRLYGFGMPGQLFYSLTVPVENVEVDNSIRAIVSVLEGRGTKFYVSTELKYLADVEWDWQVKRLLSSDFLVIVPSMAVLKLLRNMGRIRFTCSDLVATVEETKMDPDSFATLQTVCVKATGIPKVVRKEPHVMELAYLVGDPEEVCIESLNWRKIWVKVSCKDPKHINGSSDVLTTKKGYMITWTVAHKGQTKPIRGSEDKGVDDGDITDEEEPDSQNSYGSLMESVLKSGASPS
uniref:DUF4283 domain-containing protein n=1 Tax=Setaria viridis TaxID=4556 RepID=A0A4U6WMD9_SETVI|nr:hypothetical protein SEVIR_1G194400v2 [Setaria viridis]